ncbi:hypothetical protein JCM21900_001898 [Sporobolomyces salmonicolor]
MDLDALRKAALSSKRRRPTAAPLTTATEEKEEGEIDEYPSTPPTTPSPSLLLACKEESKQIIAELLSYGIPADYFLSIGVSRDILDITFHELDLDVRFLPPRPSPSPASALLPASFPSPAFPPALPPAPLAPPSPPQVTSFPPPALQQHLSPALPPVPPPAPQANPDLAALEALKRQELVARKAALLARNQRQAQSLESELDTLFASPSVSAEPSPAPSETNGFSPSPSSVGADRPTRTKRRRLRQQQQQQQHLHDATLDVASVRDAVDHTEEVVSVPSGGPFSIASTSSDSVARSSFRPSNRAQQKPATKRPVATDFEADPAKRLSAGALMAQKGPGGAAFLGGPGRAEESMVIELSDDEDDEDDEDEHGESAGGATREASVDQGRGKRKASPAAEPGEDEAEKKRKQELEDKEREIKHIMERIAAMEGKQKKAAAKKAVEQEVEKVEPKMMGAEVEEGKKDDEGDAMDVDTAVEGETGDGKSAMSISPPQHGLQPAFQRVSAISPSPAGKYPTHPSRFRPRPPALPRARSRT